MMISDWRMRCVAPSFSLHAPNKRSHTALRMAASRRDGVSLEDICSGFGVSYRTTQRMMEALASASANVITIDAEDR